MTIFRLTPNNPDPRTGLTTELDGWQLTLAPTAYSQNPAVDFLTGMAVIGAMGYGHSLNTVDLTKSPPIYALLINRGGESHTVKDTDWLVTDGETAWGITDAIVRANYTVTII